MTAFLLTCNSFVFRGELVFTAQKFYEPDLLEAWKNALQRKTRQCIDWRYKEQNLAEFYTDGNPILVEDEIDGSLNITAFEQQFKSESKQPQ